VYFSSCAKEEVAPESSVADLATKKKGGGDVWKDLQSDCRCYMQVTNVYHAIKGSVWQWYDYTNENQKVGYFLQGEGDLWNNNGVLESFPSNFQELDIPSYGVHTFELRPIVGYLLPNFSIHTTVKCYLTSSNGTQQLVNTYYEVYEFGQGDLPTDENNPDGVSFSSGFSCLTTVPGNDM